MRAVVYCRMVWRCSWSRASGLVTVRDWQPATVNGNSWSLDYLFPLSVGDVTGSYTVRVRGVDAVGNRTTDDAATGTIHIDATPPTAILSTLDSTRTVISDTITLSGRITETGSAGIASLEIGLTPLEHIVATLRWIHRRGGRRTVGRRTPVVYR